MVASETSSQLTELANQAESLVDSLTTGVRGISPLFGRSNNDRLQSIFLKAEVLLGQKVEFTAIYYRLLTLRASVEPRYYEVSDALKFAAEIASKPLRAAPTINILAAKFVNEQQIEDIIQLGAMSNFDVTRLTRLCEELNSSYAIGNLMAAAMLMRAIKDHCPPIFKQSNFTSVIAQLPGKPDSSKKKQLGRLEGPLKDVADKHLHTQISGHDPLPTDTQINSFQSDLDALLIEIARRLKEC